MQWYRQGVAGSARGAPGPYVAAGTAIWRPAGPKTRPFRFGQGEESDAPPVPEGAVVGDRYRIVRLLGEGGMGRVYEAEHVHLARRVALKLLRPDRHTQEHVARFRQEARAASRIGHPAIVKVVDFAQLPDGQVYLAMELLHGESFEDWLARPGRLAEAVCWLGQIAQGLDAAHRSGVVHRDLKPQNLFLHETPRGIQPKILDFGIAKLTSFAALDEQGRDAAVHAPAEHTRVETQIGTIVGTPYYLAPERILGRPLQPAADLYGLGVILYEVLTGTVPFVHDSFMGVLAAHVRLAPLDPRQAAPDRAIPDGVALLTMSLLSKDPDRRPSAAQVAARLDALLLDERDALETVRTGPRELAAPQQETVNLEAQSDRPTIAPDEVFGSRGAAVTVAPRGPMMAFSGGGMPAIRKGGDDEPTGQGVRGGRGLWMWFGSGAVLATMIAAVAWRVTSTHASSDKGASAPSAVAPQGAVSSQPGALAGTQDEKHPPDVGGVPENRIVGGDKTTPNEQESERPLDSTQGAAASAPPQPLSPAPRRKKDKPARSRSAPKLSSSPASSSNASKPAVPAFKDDVYKD